MRKASVDRETWKNGSFLSLLWLYSFFTLVRASDNRQTTNEAADVFCWRWRTVWFTRASAFSPSACYWIGRGKVVWISFTLEYEATDSNLAQEKSTKNEYQMWTSSTGRCNTRSSEARKASTLCFFRDKLNRRMSDLRYVMLMIDYLESHKSQWSIRIWIRLCLDFSRNVLSIWQTIGHLEPRKFERIEQPPRQIGFHSSVHCIDSRLLFTI